MQGKTLFIKKISNLRKIILLIMFLVILLAEVVESIFEKETFFKNIYI